MKRVSEAMAVSRSNLYKRLSDPTEKTRHLGEDDGEILARIRQIIDGRPSYGYRRVTALLNRGRSKGRVNHKRTYRIMRNAGLLLPKHTGRVSRPHHGTVITLKSNLRWCSDTFEIRCWNGERVYVGFSLDCCDREVISVVAAPEHLTGEAVRDMMVQSMEQRFGPGTTKVPGPVQWLSDNGPIYTSDDTRRFGAALGLVVCTTPAYSPESNGMAESFVKTFKRDYVYVNDVWDADSVLSLLPKWIADYNENAPHKGLKMMSPREFREANLG